jgi:hypothetical protein
MLLYISLCYCLFFNAGGATFILYVSCNITLCCIMLYYCVVLREVRLLRCMLRSVGHLRYIYVCMYVCIICRRVSCGVCIAAVHASLRGAYRFCVENIGCWEMRESMRKHAESVGERGREHGRELEGERGSA